MKKTNDMQYHYVVSGPEYLRLNSGFMNDVTIPLVNGWLDKMNSTFKNQRIALLSNGWTEPKNGICINECFKDHVPDLYIDSGGLQVVTCGKTITEELKQQIYEHQAAYGTKGFIFDAMPISMVGQSSGRLDLAGRWYDMDRLEGCAKETGRNVAQQIRTFLDAKSECEPVFIVQGNCEETCNTWTKLALAEIPKEHHKYISCAAMSFSSAGYGMLQDIQRAYWFQQIPLDIKHLHLLGVGAIPRLFPQLVFSHNGLYKDILISYDSTSHAGAIDNGRYFINGKDTRFPRKADSIKWPMMYNDVVAKLGLDCTFEEFCDGMLLGKKDCVEKYGDGNNKIHSRTGMILTMVFNFMSTLQPYIDDVENIYKTMDAKKNGGNIFRHLSNVKSYEDFKYFEHHLGRFIESKPISKHPKRGLVDFFD